jgi:hypothetical protein
LLLPNNLDTITNYNFINQSLIEFKVIIKDFILTFFTDPGNPGNHLPDILKTSIVNSPVLSDCFTSSPMTSNTSSSSCSTVTPTSNSIINTLYPLLPEVPIMKDATTQTFVDGVTVSRMTELTNVFNSTTNTLLNEIPNITDNMKDASTQTLIDGGNNV